MSTASKPREVCVAVEYCGSSGGIGLENGFEQLKDKIEKNGAADNTTVIVTYSILSEILNAVVLRIQDQRLRRPSGIVRGDCERESDSLEAEHKQVPELRRGRRDRGRGGEGRQGGAEAGHAERNRMLHFVKNSMQVNTER